MRNFLSLLLFFVFTVSAFSQITFDKGYYVNNTGERIPALIKYADWKNNPSEVTIKLSEDSTPQTLDVKNVAEFGVDNEAKYIRATVPVDKSSQNLKNLSNHGRFESNEETVFLKLLLEGKADLLELRSGNREQYFFRQDDGEIQALIYKRYVPESTIKISENNQYQQQLYNSLSCEQLEQRDFTRTKYNRTHLVRLFTAYNNCENSSFTNFTETSKKRDAFNLSIRAGVNFSSLVMETYVVRRTIDFGDKTNLRLGLEGEYIFPFFRNKWAVIAEPTFQYYEGEAIFPEGRFGDGLVTVNYQSLEIPFGIRHYFFLNEQNRIFINATYTVDIVMGDSKFDFETTADTYNETEIYTNTGTNFSFGGGFNHKRFSLEARYNLSRALTGKKMMIGTEYNTLSLILGYNFL